MCVCVCVRACVCVCVWFKSAAGVEWECGIYCVSVTVRKDETRERQRSMRCLALSGTLERPEPQSSVQPVKYSTFAGDVRERKKREEREKRREREKGEEEETDERQGDRSVRPLPSLPAIEADMRATCTRTGLVLRARARIVRHETHLSREEGSSEGDAEAKERAVRAYAVASCRCCAKRAAGEEHARERVRERAREAEKGAKNEMRGERERCEGRKKRGRVVGVISERNRRGALLRPLSAS